MKTRKSPVMQQFGWTVQYRRALAGLAPALVSPLDGDAAARLYREGLDAATAAKRTAEITQPRAS